MKWNESAYRNLYIIYRNLIDESLPFSNAFSCIKVEQDYNYRNVSTWTDKNAGPILADLPLTLTTFLELPSLRT